MTEVYLLTDYKGFFGSKHNARPPGTGMRKDLLIQYFAPYQILPHFIPFSEVVFRDADWKGKYVFYTSSEDAGLHYKDYIEDIVYGLQLAGAHVIPEYRFLRANNNKVFMEIIRDLMNHPALNTLSSGYYGSLEEALQAYPELHQPLVIKTAAGAMSSGVARAVNTVDLKRILKKFCRTPYFFNEFKNIVRTFKYPGYVKDSKYRQKIIVQNFIPGLSNDWKILIFGKKYYIFKRPNRKNDFRASGSGHDIYNYGDTARPPQGIFDFASQIFTLLDVPHLSIDIGYDGKKFHLLEFQAIYFGTVGHERSNCYYEKSGNDWTPVYKILDLEQVYCDCIAAYIKNQE